MKINAFQFWFFYALLCLFGYAMGWITGLTALAIYAGTAIVFQLVAWGAWIIYLCLETPEERRKRQLAASIDKLTNALTSKKA